MRPFVIAASVAGCALAIVGCAYKPGSFAQYGDRFAGERVTVGCLDVAVGRRLDHGAWPVLEYKFGNRCDRPTTVDLAFTNVLGRSTEGAEIALAPYDPKAEISVQRIDARMAGGEVIAYPTDVRLGQVCVDVASIARAKPARWVCMGDLTAVAMNDPAVAP
jgi:hypothetical protein